jgi:hypothetical protein
MVLPYPIGVRRHRQTFFVPCPVWALRLRGDGNPTGLHLQARHVGAKRVMGH